MSFTYYFHNTTSIILVQEKLHILFSQYYIQMLARDVIYFLLSERELGTPEERRQKDE